MTVYQRQEQRPGRLLLALIVFIFGMTFTMSEVQGIGLNVGTSPSLHVNSAVEMPTVESPSAAAQSIGRDGYVSNLDGAAIPALSGDKDGGGQAASPPVIPEPTTILLLGLGLSGLVAARSKII
ncbi:MAG: PEP-CTERM sorting domain-containing protein [Candidatus Zixiibacteriota bacterium]